MARRRLRQAGSTSTNRSRVYVYQRKDCGHYELISKIKTRPGSGTSVLVPQFKRLYVASQAIDEQDAAILVFEPVPRDHR
jgi:hypothetical protein